MFPDVWLKGSTPKNKLERNFNKCLFQNAMMMAHIVRLKIFNSVSCVSGKLECVSFKYNEMKCDFKMKCNLY